MKNNWTLVLVSVFAGIGLGVTLATFFRWDLSTRIDWVAVGAVATAVASAATGFAAYVGLRAVDNWRQGNLHKGAVESILAFEAAANNFKDSLKHLEFHLIKGVGQKELSKGAQAKADFKHRELVKATMQCEAKYENSRKQLLFYAPDEDDNLLTANQVYRNFDTVESGPGSDERFKHVDKTFVPVFKRLEVIKSNYR